MSWSDDKKLPSKVDIVETLKKSYNVQNIIFVWQTGNYNEMKMKVKKRKHEI